MKNLERILMFAFAIMLVVVVMCVGLNAIDRSEIIECHAFQKKAQELPMFYITQVEQEMCSAHNIIINAKVK